MNWDYADIQATLEMELVLQVRQVNRVKTVNFTGFLSIYF